jgi:hypothetical protein
MYTGFSTEIVNMPQIVALKLQSNYEYIRNNPGTSPEIVSSVHASDCGLILADNF